MRTIEPPTLERIRAARARIAGSALRTPLLRLNVETAPAAIWLKLENLQPIGSFKLRGAGNAIALLSESDLARGVYRERRHMACYGVAWNARGAPGVPCTVVSEHAPQAKLDDRAAGRRRSCMVPFDAWWKSSWSTGTRAFAGRTFIHPVSDPRGHAGNGTIGLEILEDLPGVETVLVPYGGGGLSCGIASALRALAPGVRVIACEVETAAPLTASLAAGEARQIDYTPSFVDGIGAKGVLEEMWPLASRLLDGSCVVSLAQTAAAVKLLVERNRVVAERPLRRHGAPASSAASRAGTRHDPRGRCSQVNGDVVPRRASAAPPRGVLAA